MLMKTAAQACFRQSHILTDTAELLLLLLLSRLCSTILLRSRDGASSLLDKRESRATDFRRVSRDHLEITWRSPGDHLENVSHPGLALSIVTGTCGHVVEACRVVESPRPAPPRLICDPATSLGLENALQSTSGHPRQSDSRREPRQDGRTCNLSTYTRTGRRRLRSARHGWHLSNWFARFTTSGSTDPSIQVGLALGLAPPARRIGRPRRHASAERARARASS